MRNSRSILLVEDDVVDILTVKRALKRLQIDNALVHLKDGEDAMKYLQDKTNVEPCIIILDLNVPKLNGLELLKIIKADERLKSIPVVVLTTSEDSRDIEESFGMGAAGYVVKPVDFNRIVTVFGTINTYWSVSELPVGR
ncbi:MAG: two-component system response regulator [Planctomycetes bacterium RBG_13_46_10]|nr:MAG: two-component system response regulator [Planctomycetes bacterium RBG_13_46_10]